MFRICKKVLNNNIFWMVIGCLVIGLIFLWLFYFRKVKRDEFSGKRNKKGGKGQNEKKVEKKDEKKKDKKKK